MSTHGDRVRSKTLSQNSNMLLTGALLSGLLSLFAVSLASANVVGSDAQNFNPTTSGLDFVTVQSSETLDPGVLNLGLFSNYAKNTFPYYESTGTTQRIERNNALLGGDLNLGLGLGKNWDFGISFPVILGQTISNTQTVGHFSSTGNTEIRANTKYRLFGSEDHGMALVASANFNRIDNNPYVGKNGGPIYNLELAADATISQVAVALNIGHRWRNPGQALPSTGIEPIPDQWLASTALSYLFDSIDTKVIFEVLAAIPKSDKLRNATDREYSVMEALLGVKYDHNSTFSFHLGAGSGLMNGVSSPDFRVYGGLNIAFGSLFGKQVAKKTDPYYENQRPTRVVRTKVRQVRPKAPKVTVEEPPPSVAIEKVREVPVINRKSYNHIVLNSIEFMNGTMELHPASELYLTSELIPALRELNRRRPIDAIVVEGHTDSLGSESYNLKLSEERAALVGTILRKNLGLAIPVQTVGLGESNPIADNGNFQGRTLNRRVEFKILYRRSSR